MSNERQDLDRDDHLPTVLLQQEPDGTIISVVTDRPILVIIDNPESPERYYHEVIKCRPTNEARHIIEVAKKLSKERGQRFIRDGDIKWVFNRLEKTWQAHFKELPISGHTSDSNFPTAAQMEAAQASATRLGKHLQQVLDEQATSRPPPEN